MECDCAFCNGQCYICDCALPKFVITPALELPDGTLEQCCEICADENFPDWREDGQPKC